MFKSFVDIFYGSVNKSLSKSDNSKPHTVEILKHSQHYSKLLDIYVDSARQNVTMKKWFKIIFFIVTIISLIAIVCFFFVTLLYAFKSLDKFDTLNGVTIEAVLSIVTIMVPSISSLIVAFIKIPKIIAQYLFDSKEDSYMNSIIKNIQDYDKVIFSMEQKLEGLLSNTKDQNIEVTDDTIDDSPTEDLG